MHGLKSFLVSNLVVSIAAVNPSCSNQPLYSLIAAQISGFPEAQSYCSQNFPIPTKTTTLTAPTSTVSTTVATNTVTSTTSTVVTTATSTTSVVVTVTKNAAKRALRLARSASSTSIRSTVTSSSTPSATTAQAASSAVLLAASKTTLTTVTTSKTNAALNAWQSVLSLEKAILGQICTCAENPRTSTVYTTPITTTSITATSTTNTDTTSTVTVTTTALSTQTVVPCTGGSVCSGGKSFTIKCDTIDTDGGANIYQSASNWSECAQICGADSKCKQFDFRAYGECWGYYYVKLDQPPLGAYGGTPGFVFGYQTGTC